MFIVFCVAVESQSTVLLLFLFVFHMLDCGRIMSFEITRSFIELWYFLSMTSVGRIGGTLFLFLSRVGCVKQRRGSFFPNFHPMLRFGVSGKEDEKKNENPLNIFQYKFSSVKSTKKYLASSVRDLTVVTHELNLKNNDFFIIKIPMRCFRMALQNFKNLFLAFQTLRDTWHRTLPTYIFLWLNRYSSSDGYG